MKPRQTAELERKIENNKTDMQTLLNRLKEVNRDIEGTIKGCHTTKQLRTLMEMQRYRRELTAQLAKMCNN